MREEDSELKTLKMTLQILNQDWNSLESSDKNKFELQSKYFEGQSRLEYEIRETESKINKTQEQQVEKKSIAQNNKNVEQNQVKKIKEFLAHGNVVLGNEATRVLFEMRKESRIKERFFSKENPLDIGACIDGINKYLNFVSQE